MSRPNKPATITVRLTAEQRDRIGRAAAFGPYRASLTDIIASIIETPH